MDMPVRDPSRTEGADLSAIAEELGPQATTVCVVGLGYVGLPVAVEFGKQRPTVGFDLATKKIVVVKSAQHFHASFAKIAREILYVGAPGSADPNWANLPYKKIRQPKWPIS